MSFKLTTLPSDTDVPLYDRSKLRPRHVHLGFGAFSRAHLLGYHQDYLHRNQDSTWGITVTDLKFNADRFGPLKANNHLYSVLEYSDTVDRLRVIGAVVGTAHPKCDGYDGFFKPYLVPELALVTLTVTEKGYCLVSGELDVNHPEIKHDLQHRETPQTAPGALVEALHRRRDMSLGGFTLLSLDNLPSNGVACRTAVLSFAQLIDPELTEWIATNVTFPCSMVDRIVPALTKESEALIRERLGFTDINGIVCEPFRQWVIEDNFIKGRPDWDAVGAQFVTDVDSFEKMKLRMLNGTHSAMAYLGYLAGYETIADTIADEHFRKYITEMMTEEIAPTIEVEADLQEYRDALLERYSNSMLKHRTWQIAMDGSKKLPQRVLDTIRDRYSAGETATRLTLVVAGWMRYVSGKDETGVDIDVRDPMSATLRGIGNGASGDVDVLVADLLNLHDIFSTDLPAMAPFYEDVLSHLQNLCAHGTKVTIRQLVEK